MHINYRYDNAEPLPPLSCSTVSDEKQGAATRNELNSKSIVEQ